MYKIILLATLCLSINKITYSQRLNPDFGKNGIITVRDGNRLNLTSEFVYKIFPLNDGKSILVISVENYVYLSRRLSDGSIDKSYGDSGYSQHVKIMPSLAAAMQNDGKIVVTGPSDFANSDFVVARYNTDGSLDHSFGTNGIQFTDLGSNDFSFSIVIDNSGKIILGGSTMTNGYNSFALVRYNSNGSLDASFNANGRVITDLGISSQIRTLSIQNDNKILASGPSGQNSMAIRYTTNGLIDGSYGSGGIGETIINFSAQSMALQSDGKLVIGGNTGFSSFELVRLNSDGSIDNSFNGTGQVITDFNTQYNFLNDLNIDNTGKITAVGNGNNGSDGDFAISRYNQDGSYDLNFNGTGMAFINAGSQYNVSYCVAVHDGGILIGGGSYNGNNYDYSAVRLDFNGNYDPSFGSSGKLNGFVPLSSSGLSDFIKLSNDKFILLGSYLASTNPYESQNFLKQITSNGDPDISFGDKGMVKVNGSFFTSLTNGKYIVAGSKSNNQQSDLYLECYLPNGAPDLSFGSGGTVSTDFGGSDFPTGIKVQQDGKFVVAGSYFSNNGSDIWV
ncbi:MAG: delta-60 repeat domain-containing protein, partial [Flavisolibacter sp.]